jgi:hypothetical protein
LVTAKELLHRPDLRRMQKLNEALIQWPLPPLQGRFWASDSDSEFEDLQDADACAMERSLPRQSRASPAPNPELPPASQPWSPSILKAAPSPRRIRAPLRSCWKGPLPPRRITPAATIGDYLASTLSSSSPSRRRDPDSARIQTTTVHQVGPRPVGVDVLPVLRSGATPTAVQSRAGFPKRRLVNPSLFLAPPFSYRDALMAGSRGRLRGRYGPGRGAPVDHRGRGGNATGSGRGAPIAADHRGASQTGGHGGVALCRCCCWSRGGTPCCGC